MSDAITNAINIAQGKATKVTGTVQSTESIATTKVNDAISTALSSADDAATSLTATATDMLNSSQATANAFISSANSAIAGAQAAAQDAQKKAQAIADKANAMNDKINKLPLDKDPELIKRQIEAEILKKQAELEQKILNYKENAVEMLKGKLAALAIPSIPSFKLPVLDPKVLQVRAILTQLKEVIKQRNSISTKNISKGKELYKYPLRNVSKANLPKIPQVPKVPDLPRIPQVPRINV